MSSWQLGSPFKNFGHQMHACSPQETEELTQVVPSVFHSGYIFFRSFCTVLQYKRYVSRDAFSPLLKLSHLSGELRSGNVSSHSAIPKNRQKGFLIINSAVPNSSEHDGSQKRHSIYLDFCQR